MKISRIEKSVNTCVEIGILRKLWKAGFFVSSGGRARKFRACNSACFESMNKSILNISEKIQGEFALVTGASKGFGRELSFELARRNKHIILVALPGEGLAELAESLCGMGVQAFYAEADLCEKSEILEITERINQYFDVNLLINNAGMGGTCAFEKAGPDYLEKMIQLNILAGALLTNRMLPNLMKQERSYILNVSSIASFSPVGFKTVYPASKRFIHHFSRGLAEELRGTSVFVSVVYPGPMPTNADINARLERQGLLAKISQLPTAEMAKRTLGALFNRRRHIVVGMVNYLYYLMTLVLPLQIRLPLSSLALKREIAAV